MRPTTRKKWLSTHSLPREIRYYSLVAYPQPERISSILQLTYSKLSSDFLRPDHSWQHPARVSQRRPLGDRRAHCTKHSTVATMFVTQNAYPRKALAEAIMRFVEEDLDASQDASAPVARTPQCLQGGPPGPLAMDRATGRPWLFAIRIVSLVCPVLKYNVACAR
jgi:hypothetical protein